VWAHDWTELADANDTKIVDRVAMHVAVGNG